MNGKKHLPMAWHFERVSSREAYTFRWGRGSGMITVHRGDARGSHSDDNMVDCVPVGIDWIDDQDVRVQARKWLRANAGRGVR
ncbi:hypothetical protein OOZ19_02370 [Saccharopolyspora sp. NFXS83]|uniref:hypothetical protein n=1 Tax=Saccharopolyspora sp. NFXS83 TaxID=2993560 RepID=UPI00224B615E|nr:hypothetical protein [Saccharopolyspora sp. NFXS83]MCX2729075.1 hypothetical protein [Saccharopolyspora sp. NFXS83]